jgi:hypothetical protein
MITPLLDPTLFAETIVLDAAGNPLSQGSIVGMYIDPDDEDSGGGIFDDYQGVVMTPFSNGFLCKHQYPHHTVPVFFGSEVSAYKFMNPDSSEGDILVDDWDKCKAYKIPVKYGEFDFLWENDDPLWKRCPRIRWFMPNELIVVDGFDIKNLANRVYPNLWHHISSLKDCYPKKPGTYLCMCEGCQNKASCTTLYNCWGNCILLLYMH